MMNHLRFQGPREVGIPPVGSGGIPIVKALFFFLAEVPIRDPPEIIKVPVRGPPHVVHKYIHQKQCLGRLQDG